MNETEKRILRGAVADIEALCARGRAPRGSDFKTRASMAHAADLARQNIVAIDGARWLASPTTPPARKRLQRALDRLQQAGLVERVILYGTSRARHLRITDAGRERANQ